MSEYKTIDCLTVLKDDEPLDAEDVVRELELMRNKMSLSKGALMIDGAIDRAEKAEAERDTCRTVLKEAKELIKFYHGDIAWDVYDKSSPEMKRINSVLSTEPNKVEFYPSCSLMGYNPMLGDTCTHCDEQTDDKEE